MERKKKGWYDKKDEEEELCSRVGSRASDRGENGLGRVE